MSLNFRIGELVDLDSKFQRPNRSGGPTGIPGVSGAGNRPLTMWNPFTGVGDDAFAWDLTGAGWDQGMWFGSPEWLAMYLMGDLTLTIGSGTPTYTRSGTVTVNNDSGGTTDVPADSAPFDWVAGPRGTNRYALKEAYNGTNFSIPTRRNLRRSIGGISFWFRNGWGSVELPGRSFIHSDHWKLYGLLDFFTFESRIAWEVVQEDGASILAQYDASAWVANSWHHIMVGWSRANNRIKLWVDGTLRDTQTLTARIKELPDTLRMFNSAELGPGSSVGGHIADLRFWPLEPTDLLATTLYAIKA